MINIFMLPEYIFFTGVPGSRWSGIAQEIKSQPGYNTTDRAEHAIQDAYPLAWIQLVYRPDWASFLWWKKAGGFDITYPNYDWYETDYLMTKRIEEQNKLILDFGQKHSVQWIQHHKHSDIFIGTYKP